MDKFANIGKIVLIPALGIQKNYSEVVTKEVQAIDYTNTRCSGCINKAIVSAFPANSSKYKESCNNCNNCNAI